VKAGMSERRASNNPKSTDVPSQKQCSLLDATYVHQGQSHEGLRGFFCCRNEQGRYKHVLLYISSNLTSQCVDTQA
jgi:hypothetical protein